jgi:lysozyme
MRHINAEGIKVIKSHEGCSLKAYLCPAGIWTIGYGHTGVDVHPGLTITSDAANDILASDLNRFEKGVEGLLFVDATDNQFSALVSFAFNVGLHNLTVSTLLKKFNAGDTHGAADEFARWTKAGGKELPGLVSRRRDERLLFLLV